MNQIRALVIPGIYRSKRGAKDAPVAAPPASFDGLSVARPPPPDRFKMAPMGTVRDLAERFWQGDVSFDKEHPFTTFAGMEELASNVAFVSSFANVSVFRSDQGLVLFDTGSPMSAAAIHSQVRSYSDDPIHSIVYTHGHVDHVMGTSHFDKEHQEKKWRPIQVIAHAKVPLRFDRYRRTQGYNQTVNRRQFRVPVNWPDNFRYPDVTYQEAMRCSAGALQIELLHCLGETDDATWGWIPSSRTLVTGDMFIWATPNCGNPQKVQRYPRHWAKALREMAMRNAEILLPGHGPPIIGAKRVSQALTETAELLESIHDQTLAGMNAGATLNELVHEVVAPPHLLERPYLRPIYDDPQFIVCNLWRVYGGWYDGNPSHLKPAPSASLGAEISNLAGGAGELAKRAASLCEQGELALAAHLIEFASHAAPEDAAVKKIRSQVYGARSKAETSLMAKSIFADAATRGPGNKGK